MSSSTTNNTNQGGRPRAKLTRQQEKAMADVEAARRAWLEASAKADDSERNYLGKLAAAKETGLGAKRLAAVVGVTPATVRNHLAKAARP